MVSKTDTDAASPQLNDLGALMTADRLTSLGILVAGVAHEINNPITYVLGNLGDLERLARGMREAIVAYRGHLQRVMGEESADLIATAEGKVELAGGLELLDELVVDTLEGATRIRDLVRDLQLVSRPSEHSTAPVDIHDVLDSSLRLMAKQLSERASLEREYEADGQIEGDRARLAQVCLNLITNAIQACDPPDPHRHRITVRTQDTEDGIEVQISDTGTGIQEEMRKKIFLPFFTTKEPEVGTGLGLYITRSIVESHGGTIDFHSDPSSGTLFRVHLPWKSGRAD